jgi:hypothetical protein
VAFVIYGAKTMTREEVIAAILDLKAKLGRVPRRTELSRMYGITRQQIRKHFGSYTRALRECSLERQIGKKVEMALLFQDWATVTRTLMKIPSMNEYENLSAYSPRPLRMRFGSWSKVPAGLKQYAEEQSLAEEWKDVLGMVKTPTDMAGGGARQPGPRIMADRPMYGRLMRPCPLLCEPTNEQGVFFLFSCMAYDLGFLVIQVQSGFPDCEAFRMIGPDRLQRVKVELEYESRNFTRHGHNVNDCDLIVCWEHNWPECPIEVIELKKLVANWQWMIGEKR